jgi:hypothetical protein
MNPSTDITILALRNRFRVIHGARDDFETELCSGAVLFAAVLSFHLTNLDERTEVVRCYMMQTAKVLEMHGAAAEHGLRLVEAILRELKRQIDRIMDEGRAKLEMEGETLQ